MPIKANLLDTVVGYHFAYCKCMGVFGFLFISRYCKCIRSCVDVFVFNSKCLFLCGAFCVPKRGNLLDLFSQFYFWFH